MPQKHHEVVHDYSTTSNLPSICDPSWGERDGFFVQKLRFTAVGKFQQAQHSFSRLLSTLHIFPKSQYPELTLQLNQRSEPCSSHRRLLKLKNLSNKYDELSADQNCDCLVTTLTLT